MRLFGRVDPLDVVEQALMRRGWKYHRLDEGTILTGVVMPSGTNQMIAVRDDTGRRTLLFLFNSVMGVSEGIEAILRGRPPFLCVHSNAGHSEEQVAQACRLLLYENYRSLLGNFERDDRDGEIRFRIALPYRDESPTVEQVNWCIHIGAGSLENGIQKLQQVLSGTASLEPTDTGPIMV